MDVLMEYVGWRSAAINGGYVGVLAYAATSRGALSTHATQRSLTRTLYQYQRSSWSLTQRSLGVTNVSRISKGLGDKFGE